MTPNLMAGAQLLCNTAAVPSARMWLEDLESTAVGLDGPGELSFGRAGDLVVDPSNLQLHRLLGRVHFHSGGWRLSNQPGSVIDLQVLKPDETRPSAPLGPDSETRLPPGISLVRFIAGRSQYSLCVEVSDDDVHQAPPASAIADGLMTVRPGSGVTPSPGQRRVLVAMCEPVLRGYGSDSWKRVPSNRELADSLGISAKTIEKHIAEMYEQFAAAGVGSLASTDPSVDRRRLLVKHALLARVVTATDLDLP